MKGHLIDIGVNLTDKAFNNQVETILHNAIEQRVDKFIITGTKLEEFPHAQQLSEQFTDHCFFTVGIHPHYSKYWVEEYYEKLKAQAQHPKAVAIGETGLDYNRNFSEPHAQRHAFEQQLKLAGELQMPLFLHERDAHDDQLALLKRYRDDVPGGVTHCFTGNADELKHYLDLDLYIGITGWICDERRGQHLQELVKTIPLNRLLIETDAPYLLPRTLKPKPKSRRNEPAFLRHICEQVSAILDMPSNELADITTENAATLFNLNR